MPNPAEYSRFCECGCGGQTTLAPRTYRKLGYVRGQPVRFILGHNRRGVKLTPEERARIGDSVAAAWLRRPIT